MLLLLLLLLLQVAGGRVFTEVEVDEELQKQRRAQQGYIEPSFPTIAGLHTWPSSRLHQLLLEPSSVAATGHLVACRE